MMRDSSCEVRVQCRRPVTRRSGERGSALLIVFVFAAVVAISLYMELPVAAFEAQRQKEALLVFRGEQYARAVKLFVRKTGHYPSSLKDLEDTNRMRFLRHPYVDPFTGKNDWRLLHAGPGGTLMDSKVNPIQNALGVNPAQATNTTSFANSNSGSSGGSSAFGGSSSFGSSSFSNGGTGIGSTVGGQGGNANAFAGGNSFAGSNQTADSTPPEVVVQTPRQRGPAIAANGSGQPTSADSAGDPGAAAEIPKIPGQAAALAGNNPGGQGPNDTTASGDPNAAAQAGTGQQPNAAGANGAAGAPTGAGGSDLRSSMINNGGGGFQRGGSASGSGQSSQMGTLNSSGLAGVASKAGGHSIKTVNDQSDYSLWEFYYDPRKDTTPGGVQMGAYAQPNAANAGQASAGQNAGFGQSSGGFGQSSGTGQGSGFGQSSGSGFGQSSGNISAFGNNSNGGRSPNSSGSTSSFGAQNNSSGNQTDPNQNSPQNPNPAPPDN